MKNLTDSEIRANMLEIAGLMYTKGMVNAFEGNISFYDGEKVYITPSAICKGYLKSEMISVVDISGRVIEGSYKPSSELKMHLACYRMREDVKAVIHTHSPYATAYALAGKPIVSKAYPEMIIAFDKIPVASYGTPSTDEIYAGFSECIYDYNVFLLANHGIISIGTSLFDTFFKIEAAENIAKTLFITEQLGGEQRLPEAEINVLNEMRKKLR